MTMKVPVEWYGRAGDAARLAAMTARWDRIVLTKDGVPVATLSRYTGDSSAGPRIVYRRRSLRRRIAAVILNLLT